MTWQSYEQLQPSGKVVICYLIGDEGVLFSQATRRLYRLNTTAAFIWCCYEESLNPLAIAGMVAERFDIPIKPARRDVVRAFSEWKSLGLLGATPIQTVEDQFDAASEQDAELNSRRLPYSSSWWQERHYRLLDARLQIRYPCQNAEMLLHPNFAHLEVHLDENQQVGEVVFDIVEDEGGYLLLRDGAQVSNRVAILELAPIIQRQALILAYESSDCLVAIHAAAVCNGKRGVLLPGTTGSGKSTLTAALIGSGFTYLTDELTLLMPEPYRIRPAPVSLGLKRGSWPLTTAYSSLDTLPIHFQEDKEVRYLPPPENLLHSQETYSIECIVFPKYAIGKPATLSRLGTAEALYRIAEAGYAIPGGLDRIRVEELIEWIARLDCYELQMGDLGEAVHKLKDLLA